MTEAPVSSVASRGWEELGQSVPLTAKHLPKIAKKEGKFGKKRGEIGKKRKNRKKGKIGTILSFCPS